MILEIDIGNTTLKWRVSDGGQSVLGQGRFAGASLMTGLTAREHKLPVTEARVGCVAGGAIRAAVQQEIQELWGVKAMFAQTRKRHRGLTIAYDDPGRLGVDRWLAMLAGWYGKGADCCVIDCGSAITLDLVSASGEHCGGYIVPGLQMMRSGLLNNTGEILMDNCAQPASQKWGKSTDEGVNAGIFRMATEFLQSVLKEKANDTDDCRFYITGGDAQMCLSALDSSLNLKYCPDLVLDGLELAFPERGGL